MNLPKLQAIKLWKRVAKDFQMHNIQVRNANDLDDIEVPSLNHMSISTRPFETIRPDQKSVVT